MTDNPTNRRFRRLLRLPPFGVALGMSLAALLAFAAWMFVDASFPVTLEVVRIDLGLQEHPGLDMAETHAWGQLGSRLLLFAVLAGTGALATLLVFYRVVFGNRQGRSLRSLFLAVALVALWLTLALSRERIESAGFHWRLHLAVQGLKQDAAILLAEWPTNDGVLPYSGDYVTGSDGPPILVIRSWLNGFPIHETVGPFVRRTDDGGILFEFDRGCIEYHANGREPMSFAIPMSGIGAEHWAIDYHIQLEPNWFFVSYIIGMYIPDVPNGW